MNLSINLRYYCINMSARGMLATLHCMCLKLTNYRFYLCAVMC